MPKIPKSTREFGNWNLVNKLKPVWIKIAQLKIEIADIVFKTTLPFRPKDFPSKFPKFPKFPGLLKSGQLKIQ